MNIPLVHMGHGVQPCQESGCRQREPSILGAQELSEEAATAQGWA